MLIKVCVGNVVPIYGKMKGLELAAEDYQRLKRCYHSIRGYRCTLPT